MSMDLRFLSLPCVFAASMLQYIRFAKKPMSAPFHRVTERGARRLLLVGLVAELIVLRLLPLTQVYPMNASCLVCLYFWKESKRAKVLKMNEVVACLMALAAWGLPCLGETEEFRVEGLPSVLLAPRTCGYAVVLLLLGILCCLGSGFQGLNGAFLSCLPSALNFGVSAMLLKAVALVGASLLTAPTKLEHLAAFPVLSLLILAVRSAAASPLRKALEVHDTLSVLAAYGVLSGLAASITGGLIYGELAAWSVERQAVYAGLLAAHCWGMRALSGSGELRGAAAPQKAKTEAEGGGRRQVVDDRAAANEARGIELARPKSPPVPGGVPAAAAPPVTEDNNPLLDFDEGAARRRTVEDDAMMEEQLFAKALAPLAAEATDGAGIAEPQFDADFEELMRRFDEDDRAAPITELALESVEDDSSPAAAPVITDAAAAIPDVTPANAPVLTLDAQMLLDSNAPEDEDELLKDIEDIG
ncbi:unnamed protein product [Effrenium voratum]|nr:unnamed protein product [Effrenium voratum]